MNIILNGASGRMGRIVAERIEANIASMTSVTDLLRQGASPNELLEHALAGLDYEERETMPVEFHCGCNETRAARAVTALGEPELRDMIEQNETAEVICHFCGKRHSLSPDKLQELLVGAGE